MPIRFFCRCGQSFHAGDQFGGKRLRCPGCQAIVAIPQQGTALVGQTFLSAQAAADKNVRPTAETGNKKPRAAATLLALHEEMDRAATPDTLAQSRVGDASTVANFPSRPLAPIPVLPSVAETPVVPIPAPRPAAEEEASKFSAERIGDYVLEQELGRGAFGVVYLGYHRNDPERPLAVKIVESRGNTDHMMLEPTLLAKLSHPCIVALENYFLHKGRLVLVLEFIEGEDLKTCLDRGDRFSQDQVRDLLLQLGSALAHAHAQNVVHRDIKHSNILVDRSQAQTRFVLTDFGIGRENQGIQTEKHAGGTYFFMAPEQLRGRPCPQSDLWALGVVAYRMLAGRLPFAGRTQQELSGQIFGQTPQPLSQCAAEQITPDLERVVDRLLEKSLSERAGSAKELLELLGHRTPADTAVLGRKRSAGSRCGGKMSLDRQIQKQLRRARTGMVILSALYLIQVGLLSGSLLLLGMWVFYQSQKKRSLSLALRGSVLFGGLLLLVGYVFKLYVIPALMFGSLINQNLSWARHPVFLLVQQVDINLFTLWGWLVMQAIPWLSLRLNLDPTGAMLLGIIFNVLVVVLYVLAIFLPAMVGYYYSRIRRHQRARAVREAALQSAADPEGYLRTLKDFLDTRFEDVGFHLRYIEALLSQGRLKEVVVESRVLLRQDPYNFNANLLLAHAYFALGLLDDCADVCTRYLEVAGYCFEFGELREQCGYRRQEVVP